MPFVKRLPWLLNLLADWPLCVLRANGPSASGWSGQEKKTFGLAPNICYQTASAPRDREPVGCCARRDGHEPQILVNVTNDGWFWGFQ